MNYRIKKAPLTCFICGILLVLYGLSLTPTVLAQVQATDRRYIRIGSLQNHYQAYGSERAWNNVYYEGLIWPAEYRYQDNAVIQRSWMACKDFKDQQGNQWEAYGIYYTADYVGVSLFPLQMKQTAKFAPPIVYVDGNNITAPYAGEVDEIVPEQIPDRIVTNVVNTTMGLTMTRRILAFSQQYHDNYHIRELTFTNTGNTDYDADIELNAPLKGVRISLGIRYSVCYEGSFKIGGPQSWGQHTWVTKRGEDYPLHATESITEANPIVQWLRCGFAWAGQAGTNAFDNIGAPDVNGTGRLCAPQHAGLGVIHVDKSTTDKADDPNQPVFLGWHAGDTYPSLGNMSSGDAKNMVLLYDMVSGKPYKGLGGNNRMDEVYRATNPDPVTVHNDGGGTNIWVGYGPFDLQPGESITIVEAEGISGINRTLCEQVGRRWKQAYNNASDKGPFTLPDGKTTDNLNTYKNTWVYTGKDSILMTLGRAKRNYDAKYQIPQPPQPPSVFEVNSGGDRISLSWAASPSESEPGFAGYKIFRGVGRPDTVYTEIHRCGPGVGKYDDVTPRRGVSYYYYIVAYNDGSNNTTGQTNPVGSLHSNRFYTRTTEPAYLRRQAGSKLADIRVVPNPFNIKARLFLFPNEPDKMMFLNIPGHCTIRIYTENGNLIETIHHENGSGDETWNSITSSRQVVVSGIYIAHFTVTQDYSDPETNELLYKKGETAFRKFVVIR